MRVFVCHCSADREAADAICRHLEGKGIPCWIAPRDVRPGMDYDEEILDAIEQCSALLLVLSSASNSSRHVKHEVERAVDRDKPIVPVRTEPVEPSKRLALHISTRQWVDIEVDRLEATLKRVIESLQLFRESAAAISGDPGRTGAFPRRSVHPGQGLASVLAGRWELRLLLEEICCNLCRFRHATEQNIEPGSIRINQEVRRPVSGAFADIRVRVPGSAPYFVEVKHGYMDEEVVRSLECKYGVGDPRDEGASRIVLVINRQGRADFDALCRSAQSAVAKGWELEVWDEDFLLDEIERLFGARLEGVSEEAAGALRTALDEAKGRLAFGEDWRGDLVQSTMLWQLGFWRIEQLRGMGQPLDSVMEPGRHPRTVVLIVDQCSFGSYVRDTRDPDVARMALSTFYAKCRYEILNSGGMLYRLNGDQAVGLFGIPERQTGYREAALRCARALIDVGKSVSSEWQRRIDRVQAASGVHIGIALGEVEVIPERPFARARFALVGDTVNVAHSLLGAAGPSEIAANNAFFQSFSRGIEGSPRFSELPPVEVKNVGRIQALKILFD